MQIPNLDYNYWLNGWNNAIGNAKAYSNINIIPWSNFQGTLLQCEAEILNITNKQDLSDEDIFRAIDLINQWGGKTSRMFYAIKNNQNVSSRQLIMEEQNLSYYKEGINLARANNYDAVDYFKKVNGIGASFMGKHAAFWSGFNMVIIDNKIAGTLGYKNPNSLLSIYNYTEFMNHINSIKINNDLQNPVYVERGIFSFHSNYFDNENTRFKSDITDFTDLNYAIDIADRLNIEVPKYIWDIMPKEKAIDVIGDDSYTYKYLRFELKCDRDILLKCNPDIWLWDEEPLNEYKAIIKKYYSKDVSFIREGMLKRGCDSSFLIFADDSLSDNEELMLDAIRVDVSVGNPILWGSVALKNNLEFLLKAIEINPELREVIDEDDQIATPIKNLL